MARSTRRCSTVPTHTAGASLKSTRCTSYGPDCRDIANQVMSHLLKFATNPASVSIAGMNGRNLIDNPYWSPDLAARAAELARRRHVLLLALSLSKTQNDRGRVRWTMFGASEQGPEKAFWNSFYTAPRQEMPQRDSRAIVSRLLSEAFGVATRDSDELHGGFSRAAVGSTSTARTGCADPLPSWTQRFLLSGRRASAGRAVRTDIQAIPCVTGTDCERAYLDGRDRAAAEPVEPALLGHADLPARAGNSTRSRSSTRCCACRAARDRDSRSAESAGCIIRAARQPRRSRIRRCRSTLRAHAPLGARCRATKIPAFEAAMSTPSRRRCSAPRLSDLDLYHKPMARNCQIWTRDGDLILNGPTATRAEIRSAANRVLEGGVFLYRFEFPAMRVGRHEVFWQRPLAACWSPESGRTKLLEASLPGYLTAYECERPDCIGADRVVSPAC